jgi:hypothetical protein
MIAIGSGSGTGGSAGPARITSAAAALAWTMMEMDSADRGGIADTRLADHPPEKAGIGPRLRVPAILEFFPVAIESVRIALPDTARTAATGVSRFFAIHGGIGSFHAYV